jgi:cytochrome c553
MRFAVTLVLAASLPLRAFADADFESHVRPLLAEHCWRCHGEKAKAGLRLDSREAILAGGDSGPAMIVGQPDKSLLVRALEYQGELRMPPKGKLSTAEVLKVKLWIARGAPWPMPKPSIDSANVGSFQTTDAQRTWWAFRKLGKIAPPPVKAMDRVRNDIDRFILHVLEAKGMSLAPAADRRTLIRRVTFDLTGLPPSPEEVEAFSTDDSAQAFEKVVDRLLASPAYGQRWARHWLDVARYADYHDGNPKARTASCEPLEAWRYRDWVVDALNRDLPFDQFVVHQIAGDLLASPEGKEVYPDGLVATTFLSNGVWDRGDACKAKIVSDMVQDQIDTIGQAFMGLTLGCARCHHHKFDPISQEDYYGLAGIFYSTHILKNLGAPGAEYELNRVALVSKSYLDKQAEQRKRLAEIDKTLEEMDKASPKAAGDHPKRMALAKEREKRKAELLPPAPMAEAAQEGGTPGGLFPKFQDVPLHIRGNFTRLGPIVPRRLPVFFAGEKQTPILNGSGRDVLARWIASKEHPLTARVIVNRVWNWHFGTGLVRTPNNFGLLSEPPSHPELLDWLATQFLADGWSLKKLHRRLVLSATYQQASAVASEIAANDPDNRWLGRFSSRRLEAEAIRDAMLAVNGTLDLSRGGPAAPDLSTLRRSLYVQTARFDRGSFAILFDAANPDASVEKRHVSTAAPQALFLLNHPFSLAAANQLAKRLLREAPNGDEIRIQRAYRLLFGRSARDAEITICLQVLSHARTREAEQAWTDLAQVLLCSNEFVFID